MKFIFIQGHPNIIWVATNQGFYKSSDAGANWSKKIASNIKDFKLKPGDPNIIYAVSTSKLYKSTDAGETFHCNIKWFT